MILKKYKKKDTKEVVQINDTIEYSLYDSTIEGECKVVEYNVFHFDGHVKR